VKGWHRQFLRGYLGWQWFFTFDKVDAIPSSWNAERLAILSTHGKLCASDRAKLAEFLDAAMGGIVSDERRHGLLGQQFLPTVVSIQRGPLKLMCDFDLTFPSTLQEVDDVDRLVEPLLKEFTDFDNLEDEDCLNRLITVALHFSLVLKL
jgi:hypothetical protein